MISSIFHLRTLLFSFFFPSIPRSPNLIVRVKTGSSADPLHKRHPVTEQVHLWRTACCVYVYERVMDGVTSVYDAWRVIFRVRKRVGVREVRCSPEEDKSVEGEDEHLHPANRVWSSGRIKLQILTQDYSRPRRETF